MRTRWLKQVISVFLRDNKRFNLLFCVSHRDTPSESGDPPEELKDKGGGCMELYEMVKLRYVLALRSRELAKKISESTEKERLAQREINKEIKTLTIKAIHGELSPAERERINNLFREREKLSEEIKNKTKYINFIKTNLNRKVRIIDQALALCLVDYVKDVLEPVQQALDGRPELAEVVVISGGSTAKGGRGG